MDIEKETERFLMDCDDIVTNAYAEIRRKISKLLNDIRDETIKFEYGEITTIEHELGYFGLMEK